MGVGDWNTTGLDMWHQSVSQSQPKLDMFVGHSLNIRDMV